MKDLNHYWVASKPMWIFLLKQSHVKVKVSRVRVLIGEGISDVSDVPIVVIGLHAWKALTFWTSSAWKVLISGPSLLG